MTDTTISPFVVGGVTQVELADETGAKKKYWRKEILPSGTRKYQGQELDFSKISPSIVKAFNEGAVDAVPFVLALEDNKHPETGQELKQLEGDLHKLELSKEGNLFGYFDLSDEIVSKIRKSSGKLGVSTRIDVNYERKDTGAKYPYALRHVCGTTAAHIKGMKPWETVELSEEDQEGNTFDFSTEVIEEKTKTKETGDDLVAVDISKEELAEFRAFLADVKKSNDIVNKFNEKEKDDTAPVKLTEEANKRIELAETTARSAIELTRKAQAEAAVSKWDALKRELALAGVPPVMLTAAEPVMRLYSAPSIDLTDTDGNKSTVDSGAVVLEMLEAAKGVIVFSEEGHSFSDSEPKMDKQLEELEKFFLS
jgi:hypothetical protein